MPDLKQNREQDWRPNDVEVLQQVAIEGHHAALFGLSLLLDTANESSGRLIYVYKIGVQ